MLGAGRPAPLARMSFLSFSAGEKQPSPDRLRPGRGHIFLTIARLLVQSGIDIKTTQSLLRHSTPTLTLAVYTHTLRGSEQAAIDRLPGFDSSPQSEQQRATGTEGKYSGPLTNQLTKTSGFSGHSLAFSGTADRSKPDTGKKEKTPLSMGKTEFLEEKRRGRDSNPGCPYKRHDGLANRCLKPLGHLSNLLC